jgi:hypothetical protein
LNGLSPTNPVKTRRVEGEQRHEVPLAFLAAVNANTWRSW